MTLKFNLEFVLKIKRVPTSFEPFNYLMQNPHSYTFIKLHNIGCLLITKYNWSIEKYLTLNLQELCIFQKQLNSGLANIFFHQKRNFVTILLPSLFRLYLSTSDKIYFHKWNSFWHEVYWEWAILKVKFEQRQVQLHIFRHNQEHLDTIAINKE